MWKLIRSGRRSTDSSLRDVVIITNMVQILSISKPRDSCPQCKERGKTKKVKLPAQPE